MRIRVYVDGLNFYYNVARVVGLKWLDLEGCLRLALEGHLRTDIEIERIKLFTSIVVGDARARQETYYAALQKHSPSIEIKLGKFRKTHKEGRQASHCPHCDQGKGDVAKFIIQEEKQTDVNLATAIVRDAYTESEKFDFVCVVSNDSDFLASLVAKKELNQRTILLPPLVREHIDSKNIAKALRNELLDPDNDYIKHFTEDGIRRCALPDVVAGKFRIPDEWRG